MNCPCGARDIPTRDFRDWLGRSQEARTHAHAVLKASPGGWIHTRSGTVDGKRVLFVGPPQDAPEPRRGIWAAIRAKIAPGRSGGG